MVCYLNHGPTTAMMFAIVITTISACTVGLLGYPGINAYVYLSLQMAYLDFAAVKQR